MTLSNNFQTAKRNVEVTVANHYIELATNIIYFFNTGFYFISIAKVGNKVFLQKPPWDFYACGSDFAKMRDGRFTT